MVSSSTSYCVEPQPSACTATTSKATSAGKGRRRRKRDSNEEDGESASYEGTEYSDDNNEYPEDGPIDEDFEADARFVKMMMSIEEEYRYRLGHTLETRYSVIESKNKTGFLLSCTFKGRRCDSLR